MPKDIMLFGMQGSGKGTQGKILAQKQGYKMFETGAELRKLVASGTDLGNKIKTIIDAGDLVSTPVVMEVIENFVKNLSVSDRVIFDGIPRNIEQMYEFDKLMNKLGKKPLGVNIYLTKKEALLRLSSRFECVGVDTTNNPLITEEECIKLGGKVKKRDDDNEKSIMKRLDNFDKETQKVIDSYEENSRMLTINGIQSVDEVYEEMVAKLKDN